jgi:hypothetical protein
MREATGEAREAADRAVPGERQREAVGHGGPAATGEVGGGTVPVQF